MSGEAHLAKDEAVDSFEQDAEMGRSRKCKSKVEKINQSSTCRPRKIVISLAFRQGKDIHMIQPRLLD